MKPAPASEARARRRISWIAGACAAVIAFATLTIAAWRETFPGLPTRLTFDVTFPQGVANTAEPLVVTGVRNSGDLLAIRYVDAHTGIFVYDAWAVGGPTSAPFALEPGKRRRLEIELPTFAIVRGPKPRDKRPLRVAVDGAELLNAPVFYHWREPADIAFAQNPIGGTITAGDFRGQLSLDGRTLRGGPEQLFGWVARVPRLVVGRIGGVVRDLALSALAGLVVVLIAQIRLPRSSVAVFPAHRQARHTWFAATAAACTIVFTAVITGGTFRLIYPDEFGNFYDYQAASLLAGRLDVPDVALGGEAFVFKGKTYGYFGPTPAVLRIPFVAAGIAFGQLTRSFMVLHFIASLIAAYLLLIHVQRLATGAGTWPSRFSTVTLTVIAGLGTTIFFVGSRAYVYHEAIISGIAFALWASLFALRWFESPQRNGPWLAALLCGVASVHARPPVGLFALSMLGCTALALVGRAAWQARTDRTSIVAAALRPFSIAVLAGFGVLSFNAISYLKFKSFEGAPLRYHVQYHPERLANIAGKNFHTVNIPFNASSYFWRPDFELRRQFPYFFIHSAGPGNYPDARIDLAEPVAGMPYTMPAAFALAAFGSIWSVWRWPRSRGSLGIVAGALAPMTLALLTAVAVSQRYTGDFVPGLLLGAAFGLVALEALSSRTGLSARILVVILVVFSILITIAITLHYQGEGVWGVPDDIKHRYESIRASFDGFFGSTARAR